MNGILRADIKPGMRVKVVQKQDQRSGKLTEGIVSIEHPSIGSGQGIKSK